MNNAIDQSFILSLEKQLETSLIPVRPDPHFKTRLRSRLTSSPVVYIEQSQGMKAYLTIGMGFFLGALLLWLIKRWQHPTV